MRFLVAAVALTLAVPAHAQGWGLGRRAPDYSEFNTPYDGRFIFVRLQYTPASPREQYWDHDYPRAERHLVQILKEVTFIDPYLGGGNVIRIGDPDLHRYPIAYMSEPGFWTMDEEELENLRSYVQKGGFLIFDDFAGDWQWNQFETQIRTLLPGVRLVRLDETHPIFDSFFQIESLTYSHPYYGLASEFWGAYEDNDPEKRLLFIANFNNDIGEYWEFSDTGFLPIDLSNEAYKLGVNYLIYSMTH